MRPDRHLLASIGKSQEDTCSRCVVAYRNNDGVVLNVAAAAHRADDRTADQAAPVTGSIVVQECDLVCRKSGIAAGSKDIRYDLSVAAGTDDQDHRALPMNSCAVA
jgi:hypothetical protein